MYAEEAAISPKVCSVAHWHSKKMLGLQCVELTYSSLQKLSLYCT